MNEYINKIKVDKPRTPHEKADIQNITTSSHLISQILDHVAKIMDKIVEF